MSKFFTHLVPVVLPLTGVVCEFRARESCRILAVVPEPTTVLVPQFVPLVEVSAAGELVAARGIVPGGLDGLRYISDLVDKGESIFFRAPARGLYGSPLGLLHLVTLSGQAPYGYSLTTVHPALPEDDSDLMVGEPDNGTTPFKGTFSNGAVGILTQTKPYGGYTDYVGRNWATLRDDAHFTFKPE